MSSPCSKEAEEAGYVMSIEQSSWVHWLALVHYDVYVHEYSHPGPFTAWGTIGLCEKAYIGTSMPCNLWNRRSAY